MPTRTLAVQILNYLQFFVFKFKIPFADKISTAWVQAYSFECTPCLDAIIDPKNRVFDIKSGHVFFVGIETPSRLSIFRSTAKTRMRNKVLNELKQQCRHSSNFREADATAFLKCLYCLIGLLIGPTFEAKHCLSIFYRKITLQHARSAANDT